MTLALQDVSDYTLQCFQLVESAYTWLSSLWALIGTLVKLYLGLLTMSIFGSLVSICEWL